MSEAEGFDIDPQAFLAPADERSPDPTDERPSSDSSAAGIASLERIEAELGDVEHALSRLDEGHYGVCDACGADIADAWLAEHPAERRCADHRVIGGSVGNP